MKNKKLEEFFGYTDDKKHILDLVKQRYHVENFKDLFHEEIEEISNVFTNLGSNGIDMGFEVGVDFALHLLGQEGIYKNNFQENSYDPR